MTSTDNAMTEPTEREALEAIGQEIVRAANSRQFVQLVDQFVRGTQEVADHLAAAIRAAKDAADA